MAAAFGFLAPGDAIIAFDADFDLPRSSYPVGESPAQAIDGDINTSDRNFEKASGLIVTPSAIHSQTEHFTITTSATNPERDPQTYTLYGTLDPVLSFDNGYLNGEDWTLIQSGTLSLRRSNSRRDLLWCGLWMRPPVVRAMGSFKGSFKGTGR